GSVRQDRRPLVPARTILLSSRRYPEPVTVEPGWIPPEVDTTKANVARVYDYWVGGDHNFQADRDLARTITALDPHIRTTMRANRAFLGRVVRFLAGEAGIRQFLDIGSGIPTENNVHQV